MKARSCAVLIAAVATCLAMVGSARAADITWTAAVDTNWDLATLNWKDSGGNPVLYQVGDNLLFDETAANFNVDLVMDTSPASITVIVNDGNTYDFDGSNFSGPMTLLKQGTGTLDWRGINVSGGWSGGTRIEAGTLLSGYTWGHGPMGSGGVTLAGGTWQPDRMDNEHTPKPITVETDSNLTGGGKDLVGPLLGAPGATLTVSGGTLKFFQRGNHIPTWQIGIVDDALNDMIANTTVDISDGELNVTASGTQTLTEYVLMDYSGGSLVGTFDAYTVPAGWDIDYAHDDGNQIALVPFVTYARDSNYIYWNVDGDGAWAANANWDPNSGYPNAVGVKVRFGQASSTGFDANDKIITIGAGETITVGHMLFEDNASGAGKQYSFAAGDPNSMVVLNGGGSDATITITADVLTFPGAGGPKVRLDSNLIIDNQAERGYEIDLHSGGSGWDSNGFDIILDSNFGGSSRDNPEIRLTGAPSDANIVMRADGYLRNSGSPNRITLESGAIMNASGHGTPGSIVVEEGAVYEMYSSYNLLVLITISGDGTGSGALSQIYDWPDHGLKGGVKIDGNAMIGVGAWWGDASPTMDYIEGGLSGDGNLIIKGIAGRGVLQLRDGGSLQGTVSVENARLFVSNTSGKATGSAAITVAADSVIGGAGAIENLVLYGELRPGRNLGPSGNNMPLIIESGSLDANDVTFMDGAVYVWELTDAASVAGVDWDLLNLSGTLTLTDANWTLDVDTLSGSDANGDAIDFVASSSYSWQVVAATSVVGFDVNNVTVDLSGFTNPGADTNLFAFRENIGAEDTGLYLSYTAEQLLAIADANWGDANTWDLTKVPESFSTTLINDHTVTVDSAGQVAMKVVIDAGDHLKVNAGADLAVGYQLDVSGGGQLTVDGALTSPTGTVNIASTLTVGATGSLSAKNIVVSSNNSISTGTVTATGSLQVTGSSSLDMTGANLDVSAASVAIDTGSMLTVNQSTMAMGGDLAVDGDLVLNGTTVTVTGYAVNVGGTITANLAGTTAGLDLDANASLNFSGSALNLIFADQVGGGDYYGLRWAGSHGGEVTGWLSAGTKYTGDGKIVATAPGSLNINAIKIGYDGSYTYIGFGSFPEYTGPVQIATLTFDNLGSDVGYTTSGGTGNDSGVTNNAYDFAGDVDGNYFNVRQPGAAAVLTLDPIDCSGYASLQVKVSLGGGSGTETSDWMYLEVDPVNDGNWYEVFQADGGASGGAYEFVTINGIAQTPDTQLWPINDLAEFTFDLPSWIKDTDANALVIRFRGVTSTTGEAMAVENIILLGLAMAPPYDLGDVNGDGNIDNLDITPFIYALVNGEALFDAHYPTGEFWAADCKTDGYIDNLDITPFIAAIVSGGEAVPEPITIGLLAAGGVAVLLRRRRRRS